MSHRRRPEIWCTAGVDKVLDGPLHSGANGGPRHLGSPCRSRMCPNRRRGSTTPIRKHACVHQSLSRVTYLLPRRCAVGVTLRAGDTNRVYSQTQVPNFASNSHRKSLESFLGRFVGRLSTGRWTREINRQALSRSAGHQGALSIHDDCRPGPRVRPNPYLTGNFAPVRRRSPRSTSRSPARSPSTSTAATCASGRTRSVRPTPPATTGSSAPAWCTACASATGGRVVPQPVGASGEVAANSGRTAAPRPHPRRVRLRPQHERHRPRRPHPGDRRSRRATLRAHRRARDRRARATSTARCPAATPRTPPRPGDGRAARAVLLLGGATTCSTR